MSKVKSAITFDTSDVNGDGKNDLTLISGTSKMFTIYDAKNVLLKIIGAAAGTTIGGTILSIIGVIG